MTYEVDRRRLHFIAIRTLVRTLHLRQVIKVLMLSIVSFYQGLALASIQFHIRKLTFHGLAAKLGIFLIHRNESDFSAFLKKPGW